MAHNTITLKMPPIAANSVREALAAGGFELGEAPYAFFRAKTAACTITFYEKGKVVLQGKDADIWATQLDPDADIGPPPHPFDGALAKHPKPLPQRWIGIDEAGKGDYFGPLVVVAAALDRERVDLLRELGVGDSKKIADGRIKVLAREVKAFCPFRKIVIGPQRYNTLYAKIGNLNKLLAWAHARALEDLLEAAPGCTYALSDQFARDERVVKRQLMERGRAVRYEQRTKAEADPAVAVASVLARAEFVWAMERLEKVAGQRLPKGAGPPVLAAAREMVAREGPEALEQYAKLHFRTTEQVGGRR